MFMLSGVDSPFASIASKQDMKIRLAIGKCSILNYPFALITLAYSKQSTQYTQYLSSSEGKVRKNLILREIKTIS
jgi:hypothetical protein